MGTHKRRSGLNTLLLVTLVTLIVLVVFQDNRVYADDATRRRR